MPALAYTTPVAPPAAPADTAPCMAAGDAPDLHPLFPAFLDLRGRTVLVVGGGPVALRKITALLPTGARVRVGAPELIPEIEAMSATGAVEHLDGRFEPAWLDDAWLAVAATDDADVNRAVAEAAEARRLWVNVVDDEPMSS